MFSIFWFTCSLILPPLCENEEGYIIPDRAGSIANGDCGVSTLGIPSLRQEIDTFIYDDDDYNAYDIFITAMNQIFEPFGVVRDFIVTYMNLSARFIFWGIIHALF